DDRRELPGSYLAPFNSDLIQRILRSSRQEMGAARFLVVSTQQLLGKIVGDGIELPDALQESSVPRSVLVEGALDALERRYVAYYCPIDQPDGPLSVRAEFRSLFGFPSQDAVVTIYAGRQARATDSGLRSGRTSPNDTLDGSPTDEGEEQEE